MRSKSTRRGDPSARCVHESSLVLELGGGGAFHAGIPALS
jgi:hypothetical protein